MTVETALWGKNLTKTIDETDFKCFRGWRALT